MQQNDPKMLYMISTYHRR